MGWTITTIIALALLYFAGKLALTEHRWLRQARTTQGTVISFRQGVGSKGRPTYFPRVRFVGNDGQPHEFESGLGSNPPAYAIGTSVLIAYQSPSFAGRILSFETRFGFPAVLAGIGLSMLVFRLVFLVGNFYVPRVYLTGGQGW